MTDEEINNPIMLAIAQKTIADLEEKVEQLKEQVAGSKEVADLLTVATQQASLYNHAYRLMHNRVCVVLAVVGVFLAAGSLNLFRSEPFPWKHILPIASISLIVFTCKRIAREVDIPSLHRPCTHDELQDHKDRMDGSRKK